MNVFSDFESGAINFGNWDSKNKILRVSLTKNLKGEVNHWFYFGVKGAPKRMTIFFDNGMQSRFSKGWYNYKPFTSVDNRIWERCDTAFNVQGGSISIDLNDLPQDFYFAWYPPYVPKLFNEHTGFSDYINQIGNKKGKSILITARHHPGESMGSFFLDGLCAFLKSSDSGNLLSKYNIIVVPFVNIAGVNDGMHRTSYDGADYNFAWFRQDVDKINQIKGFIEDKPVVLYFDIHGDEVSKFNYLYYTGKKLRSIEPLLLDLQMRNKIALLHRSKYKYILKVLLKKHKLVSGIKNTVEYVEQNKGCAGFVYELSAHSADPEECRIQGKNLGLALDKYLSSMQPSISVST